MKTTIYKKGKLTENDLLEIANLILDSKIIAFPTETVYGIGCHIFKKDAVKQIYDLKKRDLDKPLAVLISKPEESLKIAKDVPLDFSKIAKKFMPGPITVILKKKDKNLSHISKGDTIAVRIPDCKCLRTIIDLVKDPIVGTSANISKEINPISAKSVISNFFDKISAIIDGGDSTFKLPSTILDLTVFPYKIIRKGPITKEMIESVLGLKIVS